MTRNFEEQRPASWGQDKLLQHEIFLLLDKYRLRYGWIAARIFDRAVAIPELRTPIILNQTPVHHTIQSGRSSYSSGGRSTASRLAPTVTTNGLRLIDDLGNCRIMKSIS